jgi:hypothetical protein
VTVEVVAVEKWVERATALAVVISVLAKDTTLAE